MNVIVHHQACPELVSGAADHILDLGPDGGVRGGEVVAEGTPEKVAATPARYTGRYLKPMRGKAKERVSEGVG